MPATVDTADEGATLVADVPAAGVGRPVTGVVAVAVLAVTGVAATACAAAGTAALALARPHPWPAGWERLALDVCPAADAAPRTWIVAGLLLLTAVWGAAVVLAERGLIGIRGAAAAVAVWSVPLVAASPMISRDVYAYLAHGVLLHHGLDPYRVSPRALGHGDVLDSVDSMWRHVTSPYGPLALLIQRGAATAARDDVVRGVLLLRAVAIAATALAACSVTRLVEARHRAAVFLLVAGSPLVLVHLFNGAHLDALVVAGVAGALLAEARHRPRLALVVASCATQVKVVAVVAVAALLLWHVLHAPPAARLRTVARDVVAVVAPALVLTLLVPDGLGWVRGLGVAGKGYLPVSVATLPWRVLTSAGWQLPIGPWRAAGVLAAAAVDTWLLLTLRRRPIALTIGAALAALAVLGPAAWPWYLTWSLPALAVVRAVPARVCVMGVAAAGWATALPFLPAGQAFRIGIVGEAVVVAVVVVTLLHAGLRLPRPGRAAG